MSLATTTAPKFNPLQIVAQLSDAETQCLMAIFNGNCHAWPQYTLQRFTQASLNPSSHEEIFSGAASLLTKGCMTMGGTEDLYYLNDRGILVAKALLRKMAEVS